MIVARPAGGAAPAERTRGLVVAAMLLRATLDLARLGAIPDRFRDPEELLSACAGLFFWHTGAWSHLLDLQYKAFCGGCSVHAATAAVLLGVGGNSWLLWKLIPLGWTLIQLPLGVLAMRAIAPRGADLALLALLTVPPVGATDVGLMAWGNHPESGAFVLGAIALTGRSWLWSGVVAGLGVWFCRTTAYVLPLLLILARRDAWRVALGAAVGMLPILLPQARGEVGAYDVGLALKLDPARLATLWRPVDLGTRLWPMLPTTEAMAAIWVGAAVLAAIAGRGPALILAATFAVGFLFSTQDIPLRGGRVINLRYHAPWFLLMAMVVASAFGRPRTKHLAWAALVAMLAVNTVGWARAWKAPSLPTTRIDDFRAFQSLAFRFDPGELAAIHSDDPTYESITRRMEGYAWAAKELRGAPAPALQGDVEAGYREVIEHRTTFPLPPDLRR